MNEFIIYYRWDVDMSTVCCSKDVEIIFLALKSIVVELQEKGSNLQGRSLTTQGITIVRYF